MKKTLTTKDLQLLIVGQSFKLDCGHRCTPGHNFANTMIIISEGGKIKIFGLENHLKEGNHSLF